MKTMAPTYLIAMNSVDAQLTKLLNETMARRGVFTWSPYLTKQRRIFKPFY